jgi:serine/threonine protein kinase
MPITCPHCSSECPDQARFCGNCGNLLQPGDLRIEGQRGGFLLALSDSEPTPITRSTETPGFPVTSDPVSSLPTPFTPGLSSDSTAAGFRRLSPGTQLSGGRYRIEKAVASGGMGAVYRAIDTRFDDEPCAVKEMLGDFQNDSERSQAEEWFKREAKLLLKLNHPCIPRVRDFFQEDGRHYFVMDFIEGRTLSDVLSKEGNVPGLSGARGVSEARARSWAQQVCSVLSYLHRQHPPIIFRDLKPSNVMVTNHDEIKLIDFGIARTFQSQGRAPIIMTIGYAPPEQLHGMPEPRSDIYALGATLHRVLTNHDAANNKPTIFSFPPVRALRPDVSPAFEQVIMKALDPSLEQRWSSAAEMERAIINLPPVSAQPLGAWMPQSMPPITGQPQAPWMQQSGPPVAGAAPGVPVETPMPNLSGLERSTQAEGPYAVTPPLSPQNPYTAPALPGSPYSGQQYGAQSGYQPGYQPGGNPQLNVVPPNQQSKQINPFQSAINSAKRLFGKQSPQETELALFAIAHAELEKENRAITGKTYAVEAGISQNRPEQFRGEPFSLSVRDPVIPLPFDILLHVSENVELTAEWYKRLTYYPLNPAPQLVQFTFRVVAPGQSFLCIDFYHNRRWLRTIQLTFDAIEQSQPSTISS